MIGNLEVAPSDDLQDALIELTVLRKKSFS